MELSNQELSSFTSSSYDRRKHPSVSVCSIAWHNVDESSLGADLHGARNLSQHSSCFCWSILDSELSLAR